VVMRRLAVLIGGLVAGVLLALAGALPARAGAGGGMSGGESATVAVASNFLSTARELVADFAAKTGHEILLVNGATGMLHAQIVKGAPFDLFLSADRERVGALETAGLLAPGGRRTYALGRLVLYARDPDRLGPSLRASLADPELSRLAIADPRLAPYGRAAIEVLKALGLEDRLGERLVRGQNVAQALAFVQSGNAELGLVALALAREGGGRWIAVPATLHGPIAQDAGLLRRGSGNAAARAFWDYLLSDSAREIIRAHGYEVRP